MHCSTPCGFIPILPRGLAFILILGLLLHTSGWVATFSRVALPSLSLTSPRWQKLRRWRLTHHRRLRGATWLGIAHQMPRLLARWTLLSVLLHTSGWLALTIWSASVLLLPLAQILSNSWVRHTPSSTAAIRMHRLATELQRLYQLTLILLGLSSVLPLLYHLHPASGTLFFPLALTTWVTQPDDETEIRITTTNEKNYTVTLRGAFQLIWEPRDGFEKWMFILFVRRLQRLGDSTPILSQYQIADAFGSSQSYVSRWERLVAAQGWHAPLASLIAFVMRSTVSCPMPN